MPTGLDGACDCHLHIIGDGARYPFAPGRVYTPGPAPVEAMLDLHRSLGISRRVLVQLSSYGTDNRCMIEALDALGATARGVSVVELGVSDQALQDLHAHGVRGLRANLETRGDRDPAEAIALIETLGARIAPLGWHIQIFAALEVIAGLAPLIAASPVPIVIDHYGMPRAELGVDQSGFAALVRLAADRNIHVKLSALHRISNQGPDYAQVAPFARALIEAAPERMLWGSDWPHTGRSPGLAADAVHPFHAIDDAHDLDLLRQWAGEAVFKQILVDNPARLYGFADL